MQDTIWSDPVSISPRINTGYDEDGPFLSPDGKKLYFSSKGHNSSGGYDFFVSELVDGVWGTPVNLGYPMNSAGDDIYISFTKDNKRGYFSSNRNGGFGCMDIYSFGMLKKTINGTIKDDRGNLLAGVTVELLDLESGETFTTESDESGYYSFLVDPNKKFSVKGTKEGFFEDLDYADTYSRDDIIISNLSLEKDPGISLYVLISDAQTKEPIKNVRVTLTDNMIDATNLYVTGETGDFIKPLPDKKLQDRGSYNFLIEKEGYLSKSLTLNLLFDKEGSYNVHEYLDISLLKVEVGNDLTKIINLLPIRFEQVGYPAGRCY